MTSSHSEAVATCTSNLYGAQRSGSVHGPESVLPELILMDRLIDLLIQKAKSRIHWPDLYDRASSILGRLGLSTRQGLLVGKRLRNAQLYAASDDFGAATFELRLVRTQLA